MPTNTPTATPTKAAAANPTHTRIISILERMAQVLLILAPAAAAPFVHNTTTQDTLNAETSLALGALTALETPAE